MLSKEPIIREHRDDYHHTAKTTSDHIALGLVQFAVVFANLFFKDQYGHRAVVLETIAAIPGMVGGLFQHLKALRHIRDDHGWIKTLLSEAENERMHLMVYVHIARPTPFERILIIVVQVIFYASYFLIYLFSSRTAHRLVGYLEEEAIRSYTHYLELVENGSHKNIPAPHIAIEYWGLPADARLRDVIIATRKDEILHRDTNHTLADRLSR